MALSGHSAREPAAPPPRRSSHAPEGEPPDSPGAASAPAPGPRRGPLRRWLARAAVALLALVLLACSAVWLVGSHLDHPWVKPRVIALTRDQLGLDIDYEGLELSLLRGVRAGSFRLHTPAALSAGAPEFLRVERLELDAPLWKFAFGARSIDALRVARLEVALVRDASGRTSLDVLFPTGAEPEPEAEPARLSQAFEGLPSVVIAALEVGAIAAELVELSGDGSRRVSALTGVALRGSLQSGDEGLSGTAIELAGAPLVLTVSEGASRAQGTLVAQLGLRSVEPRSLSVSLGASELAARDFAPTLDWRGPVLELNGSLRTDASAGRATLAIERSSALGGRLAVDARSELFDTAGLRVVTSGRARVDLATLPITVPGLAIDALQLELTAKELAWDGTRVAGGVEYTGRLRGAELGDESSPMRLAELTLAGDGAFLPEGGRFRATLKVASIMARSLAASAEAADVALELDGTTRELADAQQVDARAALSVATARSTLADGVAEAAGRPTARQAQQRIELDAAQLNVKLAGTTRDLGAALVPALEASVSVRRLVASGGPWRVASKDLALNASGRQLARDDQARFGVRGDTSLALSTPSLELDGLASAGAGAQRTLAIAAVKATAELPMSLERARGSLSIGTLAGLGGLRLDGLALELEADAPLAWGEGGSRARAHGGIEKLDAGDGTRGAALALDVRAAEPGAERYRLELDLNGDSVALGGAKLAGPLALTLRADAAAADGALKLTSELRGARGGALNLGLDARFERASERLTYSANLSAEKLDAFAELITTAAPAAGRARLDRAQISASASGDLTGVLRAGAGSLPTLAERPLASARGSQSARLALEGFDYRGDAGALSIPSLSLELDSKHRADAGGTASARLRVPELAFEGGGSSLRLGGVDQAIVASFERAPDQGMVDVDTALSVGSVAQSWLPGVPVRDLRLSSNLQIDRLRSIFLRELALDNAASGSALRAAGTLELLAQDSPGSDKTIVGREALSFEGRLTQRLEPFVPLDLATHASGSLELPFRLESGGLLGYRLIAALEAKQISFAAKDNAFGVEELNGVVPIVEEFALLESGPVISAGPRASPLSDTRFFDVHPFLSGSDYITARSIRVGSIAPLGPIAANVRIERSDFIIDQLQAGYQGGQIVGQVRAAWRDGDPIVRLRLNATGVKSGKSRDVFDANTALTFVPAAMTLDGKMQIVRASREHLDDILDVLDPFHESANANRVRQGLALGYPKFVRFYLHDGAVDTKVELGGLAQLVRIDEIRAVPLGPILQKYISPVVAPLFRPAAESSPAPPSGDVPVASATGDDTQKNQP